MLLESTRRSLLELTKSPSDGDYGMKMKMMMMAVVGFGEVAWVSDESWGNEGLG